MNDGMPRKNDPDLPGLVQTNFRVPQVLLDGLDEVVRDMNREAGWTKYNRSEVMRGALERFVEEHRRKKAGLPPHGFDVSQLKDCPQCGAQGGPNPARGGAWVCTQGHAFSPTR
jgi:hypothetical protein